MRRTILLLVASIMLQPVGVGFAQESTTTMLKGACTAHSHTAEGPENADLTKRQSKFFCDAAVVSVFETRPVKVMIQFSEAEAHHGGPLAFVGLMGEPNMIALDHVYLDPGVSTSVTAGVCKLFPKGGKIASLFCGAMVEEDGRKTVAVVGIEVGH